MRRPDARRSSVARGRASPVRLRRGSRAPHGPRGAPGGRPRGPLARASRCCGHRVSGGGVGRPRVLSGSEGYARPRPQGAVLADVERPARGGLRPASWRHIPGARDRPDSGVCPRGGRAVSIRRRHIREGHPGPGDSARAGPVWSQPVLPGARAIFPPEHLQPLDSEGAASGRMPDHPVIRLHRRSRHGGSPEVRGYDNRIQIRSASTSSNPRSDRLTESRGQWSHSSALKFPHPARPTHRSVRG